MREFSRTAIAEEASVTPQYLSMLIGTEFRTAAQGLPGARRTVDTTLRQALEYNKRLRQELDHVRRQLLAAKSYTIEQGMAKSTAQEYDMTVTDTVGSSQFAGFDYSFAGSNLTYTVTDGESHTSVNQVQMQFTDSTAVTTSTTTSSGAQLNDEDNVFQSQQGADCPKCHDPLVARPRVAVYLDRTFGTFMFQDPDAPCSLALCNSSIVANPRINSLPLQSATSQGSTTPTSVPQPKVISPSGTKQIAPHVPLS
jgi:hypothetical protein